MRLSGTLSRAISTSRGLGNQLWDLAGERPSLDLPFADNKSLVDATTGAQLVTFTRASSGTYVDSTGTIRTATTNLLLRSEEFDNASWTKAGLLAFGSGSTANAAASPSGSLTADFLVEDTSSTAHNAIQSATATIGATYTTSVYAKSGGRQWLILYTLGGIAASTAAWYDLQNGVVGTRGTNNLSATIQPVGDGWYRCTSSWVATGPSGSIYFQLASTNGAATYTGDGTSGIYLWGAQLEQSSTVGEYIPTTSTINSAPRFDHNPTTGESLGLLVEEQRTNLLLQSNQFDTTWTNSLTTETPNSGIAPDGTNTAWELRDTVDASASQHLLSQTPASFVSGTVYTFSVWAKSGTLNHIALTFPSSAFGATLTSRYSLATGTAVSVAVGTTATVTAFPNGWYRVTTTATATASASGVLNIRLALAGTTLYQGDGTGTTLIWGAQLEAGAFPTSYIPTTTAAATRSADVASITGSNFSSWYRQDEGTFYSDSSILRSQIKTQAVWSAEGGTFFTSLRQPQSMANQFRALVNNVFTASTGAILTDGATRAAVAYSGVQGRLQVGIAGADATGAGTPDAITLSIGNTNGSTQLNGTIKRLTYWPTRLGNATLQTITQ